MKFTKRVATTALAGAMAMSLAVPAFAAANETKITAKYAETKIDVLVPTTGTATINPYKLDVAVKKSDDSTKDIKGQQIVSQPLAIVNKSKMKLAVDASVTVTETGAFKFVTEAIEDTDTGNNGYVYLEAKKIADLDLTKDMEDGKLKQDSLIDKFTAWGASTSPESGGFCVVTKEGEEGKETIKLSASQPDSTHLIELAAGTADAKDPSVVNVATNGGAAMFRLGGSVVKSPATAWKTTDGFTATIAFTFEPAT